MLLLYATFIRSLTTSRRGGTGLEYGLLAGMIVAVIAVGFAQLANSLSETFANVGSSL